MLSQSAVTRNNVSPIRYLSQNNRCLQIDLTEHYFREPLKYDRGIPEYDLLL